MRSEHRAEMLGKSWLHLSLTSRRGVWAKCELQRTLSLNDRARKMGYRSGTETLRIQRRLSWREKATNRCLSSCELTVAALRQWYRSGPSAVGFTDGVDACSLCTQPCRIVEQRARHGPLVSVGVPSPLKLAFWPHNVCSIVLRAVVPVKEDLTHSG